MNNGNQLNSSDTHAMAPFVNPLTSEEEYALRKAKIEEARQKLYQMELDNELQETIRKGREAEQKLADMRASMAAEVPIAARPSSGSGSGYYPNAIYPSAEDAPLTARIEGEVRESPPNSSRPPTQVPYFYHPNHPTTIQPQEPSFQAHALQFSTQPPLQRRSLGQTQAQAPARPQSSYLPYTRGPAFAVNGYQHSLPTSAAPTYPQQTVYRSHQQQRFSEDYWARQSQKYAAELAAAGAPQAQNPSAGVNPQANSLAGTGMPQHATQVQHQPTFPAAPSEAVAAAAPFTRRPTLPSTAPQVITRTESAITKPEFIRQFQLACSRNTEAIRTFLSSFPGAVEWWPEAASSVDPVNIKDERTALMLNDMRNIKTTAVPRTNSSASVSTDAHVPTANDAPSEIPAATVQPLPLPANPTSVQQTPANIEAFMRYFHAICQQAGVDKAADFLALNQTVPREWQQALINSVNPELLNALRPAWARAIERLKAASKAHLASSSAAKSDASPNHVPSIVQQSRTSISSEGVTRSAPAATSTTTESSKAVPAPPRPSVTKSTQAKPTSAHPSMASTSLNHSAATTVAAFAGKAATQTASSGPSMQPAASTATSTPQLQPLAGTSVHGPAAGGAYRPYNIPPPMSIPGSDGNVAEYAYDPYLKKYVRMNGTNEQAVPSTSNVLVRGHQNVIGQQPPATVPRGIPASTSAIIAIPPATPPLRGLNGAAPKVRTPQQANKSRLAIDILRSLGMDAPPVAAEEEDADEGAGVSLENLPTTTEDQQETTPSGDLSAEPPQEVSQETSLRPPSNVPMQQQPQIQAPPSPIKKAIAVDVTMDDESSTTAAGNCSASSKFPPPATTPCPASTSMDQEELARGVDGMSITTNVHRPEPSPDDGHIDSPISFPDLDEPLPPVSEPAGISSPAPSFKAQSREQSEDDRNEVLPLFLPSPSASPAPSDYSGVPLPPETDDEVLMVESILRGGSKNAADSDVYALHEEHSITPLRSVKRKKGQRVYVLVPPPSPDLRRAIKKRKLEDSGVVSGSEEEEESKYNDFEQALIADCRVRMVERPCQWRGCDALMNSGENLYLHLKSHAQEASSQGPFICRWQSCPRRFKSAATLEKHLQKHSYFPLPCSLANCSDIFDKPVEAMEHEVRHQQRESNKKFEMKQPPNPHVPKIPPKLDPPPASLPSYRVEPRYIRQAHIPPQRHAVIGPWVLQHIFSPVEQNLRKQNAPMRLRYPRQDARPENLENLRARPDEYDFLASLSTSPTRTIRYEDLDSAGVSQALLEGLTLWDTDPNSDPAKSNAEEEGSDPTKDAVVEEPEGGVSRSGPVEDSADLMMPASTVMVEGIDGSHWTTEGAAGEEEAVEMMLM